MNHILIHLPREAVKSRASRQATAKVNMAVEAESIKGKEMSLDRYS